MWTIFQIVFRLAWIGLLVFAVLAVSVRLTSLAQVDRTRRRRTNTILSWYLVGLALLVGVEFAIFVQSGGSGIEVASAPRIFIGLNPVGWVTDVTVWLPLVYGWRVFVDSSWRPTLEFASRLEQFWNNRADIFDEEKVQRFLRELKVLRDREPPFVTSRLNVIKSDFLKLLETPPPKNVCLQRAVGSLKKGRPADALAWVKRWNADRIEFFLLCLEQRSWNECLDRLDSVTLSLADQHLDGHVLREEGLGVLGDLPESENIRDMARKRLTENKDMRRRRAVLEFKSGRPEVALKLLENDLEASNWVRAAQAPKVSASPTPMPAGTDSHGDKPRSHQSI